MTTIHIGAVKKAVGDATEPWITQEIVRQSMNGSRPCVRVRIKTRNVDLALSTPQCSGGGGGRRPNDQEDAIIRLWRKVRMDRPDYAPGNLVAFLKQVDGMA